MKLVAALFVLPRGPYAHMEDVDPWPERRDALRYRGPLPVVAHPPCAKWTATPIRFQVGNSPSQGKHLAPAAVIQVRKWGGILEQPAGSLLWETMSLPFPEPYRQATISGPERDAWGGFTVEVDQRCWGHPLSFKPTWLYMVGEIDYAAATRLPPDLPKPKPRYTSWRTDKRTGTRWRRSPMDLAGSEGRKRSPEPFARWLVDLAATATPPRRKPCQP